VTALSLEARAADQASVDDFEVVYMTEGGAERALPFTCGVGGGVRVRLSGAKIQVPEGSAASERAVVVGEDRRPRGL
jgi:hypothetical protein